MKQQVNIQYLHMGCGESLGVSQENRVGKLKRANTTTQKPGKTRQNKRRQGNEGSR
jgi:hypothetical protein